MKKAIKPGYLAFLALFPPQLRAQIDYFRAHRRLPNLSAPETLSEKILWRKLYEHDPRFSLLADKIRVKQVIASKYGESYVMPTLAVFDNAKAIEFDQLSIPFVIKANHGSMMNIFVTDEPVNLRAIRRRADGFLRANYATVAGEWAYANIDRKLLVEPFIRPEGGYLTDYKFHVFGGRVEMIECAFGSNGNAFFDRTYKRLDAQHKGYSPYVGETAPPRTLSAMIELAEAIGSEFPYIRVDLYEVDGCVKVGELTFYPGAGHDVFIPSCWDLWLGQHWKQDFTRKLCLEAGQATTAKDARL